MSIAKQIPALALLLGLALSASSQPALAAECAGGIVCCTVQEKSFSNCIDVASASDCPEGKSPYCAVKVPKAIGASDIAIFTVGLAVAVPIVGVVGYLVMGSTYVMARLVTAPMTGNF